MRDIRPGLPNLRGWAPRWVRQPCRVGEWLDGLDGLDGEEEEEGEEGEGNRGTGKQGLFVAKSSELPLTTTHFICLQEIF
jgi:hypothetical protein